MREDHKEPIPDALLLQAIPMVIAAKKERLTSKSFLAKVKDFAVPLLKVVGIAVTALKKAFNF